ncbi:MAG: RNB domain-containing ribonuclease [Candidatus Pacebacteria bacterium]|nr:RNB domain-containing ribonuclease [Candidatus Paceibacterota bacterium]
MNNTFVGILSLNAKGKGFVRIEGREEDIPVEPTDIGLALSGDTVEVETAPGFKGILYGKITRIVERKKMQFVGTIIPNDNPAPGAPKYALQPDDRRSNIEIELVGIEAGATSGKDNEGKDKPLIQADIHENLKAIATITDWQLEDGRYPRGELVRIIGEKGDNNAEMESIVLERGFDVTFEPEIVDEAEAAANGNSSINPSAEELAMRRDMRGVFTCTIDPFDAKDFDDALSIRPLAESEKRMWSRETKSYSGEPLPNAYYEVGVHIADVAHYVQIGTELDREARKRAFSVYLVDRTIPMLPSVLSNGMCSLNPNEDRFAFSAIFTMTYDGQILDKWFGRTIIHSDRRFTYEEAQELLNKVKAGEIVVDPKNIGDAHAGNNTAPSEQDIENTGAWHKAPYAVETVEFDRLAKIMLKERQLNGSIDFESTEIKFKLDESGKPIAVYKKERLDAHRLVEEYMLLANREVAEYTSKRNKELRTEKNGVYRVHESPDYERLQDLGIFVRALGFDFNPTKKISPKEIQKLLRDVEGSPAEAVIKIATLRSMAKATYQTINTGHFGLAFEYYTQFTSPIRRYPDLMVHRILAILLEGKTVPPQISGLLDKICGDSSRREVEAADAERASIKYKQVEYMQGKIGQTFEVKVSGIADWGIYVEEPEAKAEGLLPLRTLKPDDFYSVDQKNYKVIGQNTKKEFNIGDKLMVKLLKADLETKMLDYEIVEQK